MGKLQVKERAPACGAGSCDFCNESRDPELELPVSLVIAVSKKITRLRSDRDRAAVALARQEAQFAE
jgi:hypothetical protein